MAIKTLKIFDTTLRDGEQGIGNVMTLEQKQSVLKIIDSIGLDIVELGFPAASAEDFQWFEIAKTLSMNNKNTQFCAFSRLNAQDLKVAVEAMRGFSNPQVQLLGTGSEIHLLHKRNISLQQSLAELITAIEYLKNNGIEDIALIIEDATRGSIDILEQTMLAAMYAGVTTITIPDTVGYATPNYISSLIRWARSVIGEKINLGIHCHNDLGLATANTLAAIQAGANLVQTTLGGIGERCGNCALEEVAAALHYKKYDYPYQCSLDLQKIAHACEAFFSVLHKNIPTNKAIIGQYVYSTAAGIHQNGIIKKPEVYEYVRAEDFGRERKFIFNRLSGRSALLQILQENGIQEPGNLDDFYQFLLRTAKNIEFQEIPGLYQEFNSHAEVKLVTLPKELGYSANFFKEAEAMPSLVVPKRLKFSN